MENRWKRLHGVPERKLYSLNAEIFFNAATNEPIAMGWYVEQDYFLSGVASHPGKYTGRLAAIKQLEKILEEE